MNSRARLREWCRGLSARTEFIVVTVVGFSYFVASSLVILLSGVRQFELTTSRLLRGAAVEVLILGAVAVFLHARGWRPDRLGLRFSWGAVAAGVPLFIIYLLLYWVTATLLLLAVPAVRTVWVFRTTLHAPYALLLLFLIVNSFFEELMVTAYVVEALTSKGPALAITASTLLRLGYHLYQGPLAALSIIPLGLLFATLYWRGRNVWPLIVAHTITNVVVFWFER
jgi:membrane protease YdiL (CAAX protease family)